MKDHYDFSKGRRGPAVKPEPLPAGKKSITIRIDEDVLDRFFQIAEETGKGYQTLINQALRDHLEPKALPDEQIRLIFREELVRHEKRKAF